MAAHQMRGALSECTTRRVGRLDVADYTLLVAGVWSWRWLSSVGPACWAG